MILKYTTTITTTMTQESVEMETRFTFGKTLKVRIASVEPGLLMHNALSMTLKPSSKKSTCPHGVAYGTRCDECLEAKAYRSANTGGLFVPSVALHMSMVNAAGSFRMDEGGKKTSAKRYIAGSVRVLPNEIPLIDGDGELITKYDVDARPVVVQHARVIRDRPWVKVWNAEFLINYERIADPSIIKEVLEFAGQRVGLLDFRPEHMGIFGTFRVTNFEEYR